MKKICSQWNSLYGKDYICPEEIHGQTDMRDKLRQSFMLMLEEETEKWD